MDGVIVINKPAEFTSFDVVAVMRGVAVAFWQCYKGTVPFARQHQGI